MRSEYGFDGGAILVVEDRYEGGYLTEWWFGAVEKGFKGKDWIALIGYFRVEKKWLKVIGMSRELGCLGFTERGYY